MMVHVTWVTRDMWGLHFNVIEGGEKYWFGLRWRERGIDGARFSGCSWWGAPCFRVCLLLFLLLLIILFFFFLSCNILCTSFYISFTWMSECCLSLFHNASTWFLLFLWNGFLTIFSFSKKKVHVWRMNDMHSNFFIEMMLFL